MQLRLLLLPTQHLLSPQSKNSRVRPRYRWITAAGVYSSAQTHPQGRRKTTASSTLFHRILFETKEDRPNYGELHCCRR